MLTPNVTTSAATAGSARTQQVDLGNKDIFLKLLVAQMKFQDPLKPQDATQMSSQLAQFNMVEQQTTSNKLLEQLVNAGVGGARPTAQIDSSANYLGHTVTVNQNDILFDGSSQNFAVTLNEPATEALVFIFDSNGEPVRTMRFNNLAAGANPLVWDGKTDSGASATQGRYTIQVSATNLNGGSVESSIQRSGIVDAIRFTGSGTEMMVGGIAVPLTDITEIRL